MIESFFFLTFGKILNINIIRDTLIVQFFLFLMNNSSKSKTSTQNSTQWNNVRVLRTPYAHLCVRLPWHWLRICRRKWNVAELSKASVCNLTILHSWHSWHFLARDNRGKTCIFGKRPFLKFNATFADKHAGAKAKARQFAWKCARPFFLPSFAPPLFLSLSSVSSAVFALLCSLN